MRLEKIWVIAKREYLARVRTKGFWISTVAVPLFFIGLFTLPALIMSKAVTTHDLVLVDATGGDLGERIASRLQKESDDPLRRMADERFAFTVELQGAEGDATTQRAELDRRVLDEEIDSWVWITAEGLDDDAVEYHAESLSNFLTQERIEDAVSAEVRRQRLAEAGIDADRVTELSRSIGLDTVRVDAEGSREEGGFAGFILAYALFFLLYLVIILYGQQVLNGVIEEKSSRSMEVLVSSVKPFELMLGKLLGIGSVGLSQLAVWFGTLAVLTAPGLVSAMTFLPDGFDVPGVTLTLGVNFFLCFVLGFFFYASIYAAIGSAFNNLQEAQQVAGVAVIFLIIPMVLIVPVANDPDATWVAAMSMIPLFTPLLMLLRVAVKVPPLWQMVVGYGLTFLAVGAILWIAGRIYRVGILMYGKKPTLQEIWRWVRYA
jgi:ABC-2 type transport system permease protein